MAAADDDTLQYYFGDNRTFMYDEFSTKDSIFGDSRSGRSFVAADGHDLRLKSGSEIGRKIPALGLKISIPFWLVRGLMLNSIFVPCLNTDLALVPSKLLELMMDPKVPPQNAHFDFLDEVNREEFEQVSGMNVVATLTRKMTHFRVQNLRKKSYSNEMNKFRWGIKSAQPLHSDPCATHENDADLGS